MPINRSHPDAVHLSMEHVINRLSFLSNERTILAHIKSRRPDRQAPLLFSLEAVRPMPAQLMLPLHPEIIELSVMNMQMPELEHRIAANALQHVFFGRTAKAPAADMAARIEEIGLALQQGARDASDHADRRTAFEQAVANYRRDHYVSQYDWRMLNWGTIEDVHSVNADTFQLPTRCIEFVTAWTPPIAALQYLANTFPSVRFTLTYHLADDPWQEVEFFPFPPFGY